VYADSGDGGRSGRLARLDAESDYDALLVDAAGEVRPQRVGWGRRNRLSGIDSWRSPGNRPG
jgi:hypothetical protein